MRQFSMPEPDFTDSRQFRLYLNSYRLAAWRLSQILYFHAEELEAALAEMRPVGATNVPVVAGWQRRRRARRVARHLQHCADLIVASSASAVRTWAAFKIEYAPELNQVKVNGRVVRRGMRIVQE